MTDQCRHCPHPAHMHPGDGPCKAVTVTGPAATDGKPVGPRFDHGSREVLACQCLGFAGRNGSVVVP